MRNRLTLILLSITILAAGCSSAEAVFVTADPALNTNAATLVETAATTGQWRGQTAQAYHILGRRAGFTSTSVLNDLKEFGSSIALFPVLAGNETLEIVSSSANDTALGDGVRKIQIVYIDNSNNMVTSAEISTNGTSPVPTGFTANETRHAQPREWLSGNVDWP